MEKGQKTGRTVTSLGLSCVMKKVCFQDNKKGWTFLACDLFISFRHNVNRRTQSSLVFLTNYKVTGSMF
jgi:hypothetical protein